jgi:transcriptional regulator GlxA family with amidase domain
MAMPKPASRTRSRRARILIIVVPPLGEPALVAPLQVFSAANRLAKQTVYSIQVVTTGGGLEVAGEAGVLTFLAQGRLQDVAEPSGSALLVCVLATLDTHDATLFAWLNRFGAVCSGAFLLANAGFLNGKPATAY